MAETEVEIVTLRIRKDFLFAIMNVLDVVVDESFDFEKVACGTLNYATAATAEECLNDLVDSVEEAYGVNTWVDYGTDLGPDAA